MITFDSPIACVLGSATTKGKKIIEGLGLETVGDLMHHFPRRYVETGKLSEVDELAEGQMLMVVGEVVSSKVHTYVDRRTKRPAYRLEAMLATDGPRLKMTFFSKNQHLANWHAERYAPGTRGLFIGQAGRFNNAWQLTNPRATLFGMADEGQSEADAVPGLFPIYPLTKGVETWDLMRAVSFARTLLEDLPDLVPPDVRTTYDVVNAELAYQWIHAADERGQVTTALRHFRFEEALILQLVLARLRRLVRTLGTFARDGGEGALLAAFDARLPFTLTGGQREVGAHIEADLAQEHPMNRLLQGEVGSGKTLVALRAMLRVVDSGGQAVLLAPTEVLAQQHARSIRGLLGDLASGGFLGSADDATGVELITGSMTKTQRREPLLRIASGEAGIVIGTHALLEDHVSFADLALVVVDEQHRFGVEQRAALTDKAVSPPHVLVMTATPIPRTVAMTVFGDLEISTLTELPAGRAPIQTNVVDLTQHPGWMERVWERVTEEVAKGHQVYVVCPRIKGDQPEQGEIDRAEIDEFEDPFEVPHEMQAAAPPQPLAAVEEVAARLSAGPLRGVRLAQLHGSMPAEDKEATMRAFADGAIDVLVATTVIEVGVDVPNATMMVLLDADRFGVSQLHQLRGRVGRGGLPGLCLLVSAPEYGSPAGERLEAVAATTDGFELSLVDLRHRREGDVLGKSQSGVRSQLRNLRVLRDETTIRQARVAAESLLDGDPELAATPELAEAVLQMERSRQSAYMEKS